MSKLFGFVNLYKTNGVTSHDMVSFLRKLSGIKQIGHTGTLDPMAEGVLPMAIGNASRLIEYLQEDKGYDAEIQFGKISTTYDKEGDITLYSENKITEQDLLANLQNFKGIIKQIPPAYSAVHYNGKRLYELARQGIIPDDIPMREVAINKLELVEFDYENQTAKINVECSKGTYIRSLVNDIGMSLSCGAMMTGLTRTKSGKFQIVNAVKPEALSDTDDLKNYLINPVEVLSYNSYELSEFEYKKIVHGQSLTTDKFQNNETVMLLYNENLVSMAEKQVDKLKIKKVLLV